MNDIIITYDQNLNSENRLRLLLRSIENHCEGYNEIVIVGDKPEWIQGVIHIGFSGDEAKYSMRNKYKKLRAACLRKDITPVFYWVDADDHAVKFDARKALRVSIPENSVMAYRPKNHEKICLKHTEDLMKRRGFKDIYFNRYPMSMQKSRLQNTFDDIDFETKYGYCIKTMYSNFNRLKPTGSEIEHLDLLSETNFSTYERIDYICDNNVYTK